MEFRMPFRPLLVASLALCLAQGPARAAERLVFQEGWLASGERVEAYVARQQGFFAAVGLDVEIIAGRGSGYMFTKLATGAADVGEGGFDALLGAKVTADLPVTAIMPVFTKVPDALLTTKASGITSIKDLAGKTIGTAPFNSSNLPWPFVLQVNGIDPASVTMLKADPSTLGGLLARGRVDGVIMWVTSVPSMEPIMHEAGTSVVALPWAAYGFAGYSNSLFASNKVLATRRDAVHRFLVAMKRAELAMRADPDRAAADVKAVVPEADLTVIRGELTATLPVVFNENTDRDGLGIWSPQLVATTWGWVSKEQNVPADRLDPMQSVDTEIAK
jgi:NitT/TauT family transport system substrate-binding protein